MRQFLVLLFNEILDFLTNKRFIYNLLGILAFVLIVLIGVLQWLKIYTHHGQKLEMPDYTNMHIDEANRDAEDKTFELIVNDSVHIVNSPGGIIRHQNPVGGSLVKQNRKIYVTITKYLADQVNLAELYDIYGANYDLKAPEFRSRGLFTEIRDTRYDQAENVILEVWYKGRKIIDSTDPPDRLMVEKGSTLEFVISSQTGGTHVVPSLVGMSVSTARFALGRQLNIGDISSDDGSPIENIENAIVVSQDPPANSIVSTGQFIHLVVSKPD